MRMMVTVHIPVETGNRTIKDGSLPKLIGQVLEKIRPECAYFYLENGQRTMRAVFDLDKSNTMVPNFEPLFMGLDARIELTPVMTAEELQAGFAAMG